MIYSMYWELIKRKKYPIAEYFRGEEFQQIRGKCVDLQEETAILIKESSNDSFVFIIINNQMEEFSGWLTEYKLNELEVFRSNAITNPLHSYNGRSLTLVVLASESHAWRDMFTDEGEL